MACIHDVDQLDLPVLCSRPYLGHMAPLSATVCPSDRIQQAVRFSKITWKWSPKELEHPDMA